MFSENAASVNISWDRIPVLQILWICDFLKWQDEKIMQVKYIYNEPVMSASTTKAG